MSTLNGNDDKTTSNGRDTGTTTTTSSSEVREHSMNLLKRVKPPKINYSTIVIKPSSKGEVEEGKKE